VQLRVLGWGAAAPPPPAPFGYATAGGTASAHLRYSSCIAVMIHGVS